jgi:hypothetical protein
MHHLHNLEEVVLIELLETIGKLVHINLVYKSVSQPSSTQSKQTYILFRTAALLLGALLASKRTL